MNQLTKPKCYFWIMLSGLVMSAGCSGQLPNVSGTLTVDGTPIQNASIVFMPVGDNENKIPGPFSTGTTDEQGRFSLTSRNGVPGAVAGPHRVGIRCSGHQDKLNELMFKRSSLQAGATDDSDGANAGTSEELKAIDLEIERLNKLVEAQAKFGQTIELEFTVPAEGTDAANFEL